MDATSVVASTFANSCPTEKLASTKEASAPNKIMPKPTIEKFAVAERLATGEDLDDDEIQARYDSVFGKEEGDDDEPGVIDEEDEGNVIVVDDDAEENKMMMFHVLLTEDQQSEIGYKLLSTVKNKDGNYTYVKLGEKAELATKASPPTAAASSGANKAVVAKPKPSATLKKPTLPEKKSAPKAATKAPSTKPSAGKPCSKLGKRAVVDAPEAPEKKAKTAGEKKDQFPDIKFSALLANIGDMLPKKKIIEILTICEDSFDAGDSHEALSARMAVKLGYYPTDK